MAPSVSETTINQRLKILIEALRMNPRSFSLKYGVSEGTTRNYLDRGSIPNAEYIATLLRSVEGLNANWILVGEGTMFLSAATTRGGIQNISGGNVVGQNSGSGDVTQTHNTGTISQAQAGDCEQKLASANLEITFLRKQIEDKELIIQLLQRSMPPNS